MRRLLPALAVLMALTAPAGAADKVMTLVTGNDFKPFADESLPEGGLATAIVRAAFDRAGRAVSLSWMPWKDGYVRALSAGADATFPYQKTLERAAEMLYSEPLFTTTQRVFWNHRTGRPANDPADLTGHVLCVPLGYTPPPEVIDLIQDGAIQRLQPPTMTDCFQALKDGTADYVVTNLHQANDLMPAAGLTLRDAGISRFQVNRNTLHLVASRSHPDGKALIEAFNTGLAELKADGTYDQIVRRHLGSGGM